MINKYCCKMFWFEFFRRSKTVSCSKLNLFKASELLFMFRADTILSLRPHSPALTSLHHLQDEEHTLSVRTHVPSTALKSLRRQGSTPFLSNINRVTKGAMQQFGCFTQIRLAIFSPQLDRKPPALSPPTRGPPAPSEWSSPCAPADPGPISKCNRTWL